MNTVMFLSRYIIEPVTPASLLLRCTALILLIIPVSGKSFSQPINERFHSEISLYSTFAPGRDQSFWHVNNNYGLFDHSGANALSIASAGLQTGRDGEYGIGAGIDLVAKAAQNPEIYLHQAYIEARYRQLHINAGRREVQLGDTFEELSSGSAAISRNARPIPRVSASFPSFQPFPFTDGWLEIKGHFSHGWLNDNRFVKNSYLHEKSLYLQSGGDTGVKIYVGLVHVAVWGGNSPVHGELPDGFSDYLRVMTAREGSEDAPSGEVINALGFHTGVYDFGLRLNAGSWDAHFYYQHLFTDGSGQRFRNLGDGLFGIGIGNPFKTSFVTGILIEFLNTRHQSGPGLPDSGPYDSPWFCETRNCGYDFGGRDNYYNNSIYTSGYSYYGQAIGSPFFLTQVQLDKIDPAILTYSSAYFVSTRNMAYHLGIRGYFHKSVPYRLMASYVKYYGTYHGLNFGTPWGSLDPERNPADYFFNPPQNQWYFMLESRWRPRGNENPGIVTTLAADSGDLFNNFGALIGFSWNLGTAGKSR
jgi:hypothetical protein